MVGKANVTGKNQHIKIRTGGQHQFTVKNASMEILVGGPYFKKGEEQTYGHVALRIIALKKEYIYDYGRYGETTGTFDEGGEGIMRIWSEFSKYIASENFLGRETVGYVFYIEDEKARKIIEHFNDFVEEGDIRKTKSEKGKEYMISYKTKYDYDALSRNCTTVSFDGAKLGNPDIDKEQHKYNDGRGLGMREKLAAKVLGGGWPERIFMPADAGVMLKERQNPKPDKINVYKK